MIDLSIYGFTKSINMLLLTTKKSQPLEFFWCAFHFWTWVFIIVSWSFYIKLVSHSKWMLSTFHKLVAKFMFMSQIYSSAPTISTTTISFSTIVKIYTMRPNHKQQIHVNKINKKWKGKVNVLSKCKQLKSKDESGKEKPNVMMVSDWKCDDLWLSLVATSKVQSKLKDEKFWEKISDLTKKKILSK